MLNGPLALIPREKIVPLGQGREGTDDIVDSRIQSDLLSHDPKQPGILPSHREAGCSGVEE